MHLRGRTIKQCLFLIMVPHRSPTNTSRQEQAQLPNYWQKLLRHSLRFQCSNASPNAPPTTNHFPRFSQRFIPFFHGFTRFFHGFTRFFHGFIQFFSVALLDFSMVLLNVSRVLPRFFHGFIPCSHRFTPFFHGLPNFQMVSHGFSMVFPLVFSMVLLVFSIILPFHSSLPKCTSEDGPGGNRYPTVTQLPPGTQPSKSSNLTPLPLHPFPWFCHPLARSTPGPPLTHFVRKRNFA